MPTVLCSMCNTPRTYFKLPRKALPKCYTCKDKQTNARREARKAEQNNEAFKELTISRKRA
mgnify:CR=1 FL=1